MPDSDSRGPRSLHYGYRVTVYRVQSNFPAYARSAKPWHQKEVILLPTFYKWSYCWTDPITEYPMKGSHSKSYPITSLGLIQHKTNEKSQLLFLIMFSVKGFPHDLKQAIFTRNDSYVIRMQEIIFVTSFQWSTNQHCWWRCHAVEVPFSKRCLFLTWRLPSRHTITRFICTPSASNPMAWWDGIKPLAGWGFRPGCGRPYRNSLITTTMIKTRANFSRLSREERACFRGPPGRPVTSSANRPSKKPLSNCKKLKAFSLHCLGSVTNASLLFSQPDLVELPNRNKVVI